MDNDFYNLKSGWESYSKLLDNVKVNLNCFLKRPNSKKTSILLRRQFIELKKMGVKLRDGALKLRQDYDSDYS